MQTQNYLNPPAFLHKRNEDDIDHHLLNFKASIAYLPKIFEDHQVHI